MSCLPEFYREAIPAYRSLRTHDASNDKGVASSSHIIWGNIAVSTYTKDTKTRHKNESLLLPNGIDSGIIYLRELPLNNLRLWDKFVY